MAGEITTNLTLRVMKGSLNIQQVYAGSLTLTAAVPNVAGFTQIIPTTAAGTAIALGSVATNGVAWFQNVDAANYIEIGIQQGGVFYPLARLNYGEAWTFRLAQGIVPYARANTGSVVLAYLIFDN